MNLPEIAIARLFSQQIASPAFTEAKDIVAYMGAVQAQYYAMAKWAIGLRLPGSTDKQIEHALDRGEIIRTHVLRPTWHIISGNDVYWMLALSAARIKALMKTTDRQFDLTEKIYTKSNTVIEKCFASGKHLDREAIATELEKAKIKLYKNRLSHLLIRAELEEIICSGRMINGNRTYALLRERVPKKKIFTRDESLAMLAKKYFISRGPATIADFSWWSGLTLTEARHGLEMVKADFESEKINGLDYYFDQNLKWPVKNKTTAFLLPAFDEFIISYKDRTATMAKEHHKKILSLNGIFNPAIIVNGKAIGLWKRTFEKDSVLVEADLFQLSNKSVDALIKKQAKAFSKFSGKKTGLIKVDPFK